MVNNPYKGFIRYLDKYQKRKDLSYYDALMIQDSIQKYYFNNYENSYEKWQKDNEVQFLLLNSIDEKIEKKNIDVSIHTLQDMLNILKEYPYDSKYEYNIDLKSLHKVKVELEKLII